MKKLIALSIAVLVVLGISTLSYAETYAYQNVNVNLGVNSSFGLYGWIDPDPLVNVDPIDGNEGYTGYTMVVTTNYGRAWTLQAQSGGLVGQYQGSPETLDVYIDCPTGDVPTKTALTASDQPIYTADAAEYSVTELAIIGGLYIPVTSTTLEDLYAGDVLFTLVVAD